MRSQENRLTSLPKALPTPINVNDDFRVLKSGDRFLWSSWRDGNTQLYLYSFDQQKPLAGEANWNIKSPVAVLR